MQRVTRLLAVFALGLTLSACAVFHNHGYAPTDSELSEVVVGVDTRDTVRDVIGKPSAAGVVGEDAWYYLSTRMRHWAYRAPEPVDRQLVAISFAADGTVENVERFGLEDGRVVTLSRRVTKTSIRGQGLIGQLLRNFGNINVGEALAN